MKSSKFNSRSVLITFLIFLFLSTQTKAQTVPQVIFDYPSPGPLASVIQGWTATLYVNGNPFVVTDTCLLVTTVTPNVVRCTGPLPDITTALVPTGPQNFELALSDGIMTGPKSAPPFVLTRPLAATNLRIQ